MTITEAVRCYRAGELTLEQLIADLQGRTWRQPKVDRVQPGDEGDWSYISDENATGSWLELELCWARDLLTSEELAAIESAIPFTRTGPADEAAPSARAPTLAPMTALGPLADLIATFGEERAHELLELMERGGLGDEGLDWNPNDH